MKKILLIFLLAPVGLYAQSITLPIDSISHKIDFTEVVKVDGASKDDLYIKAREWFAKTFVSAQKVIQMDDKDAGKIIGRGTARGVESSFLSPVSFTLYYTVSITMKDGRYRYEITDFEYQDDPTKYELSPSKHVLDLIATDPKHKKKDGTYRDLWNGYLQKVFTTAESISASLKNTLSQKPNGIKSKDDF